LKSKVLQRSFSGQLSQADIEKRGVTPLVQWAVKPSLAKTPTKQTTWWYFHKFQKQEHLLKNKYFKDAILEKKTLVR
jgi:hypothetical protein